MKRAIVLLALAFGSAFLSGCLSQQIDAEANAKVAGIQTRTTESMLSPSCADGAPLEETCGLIMARAEAEDFRAAFRDQKCAGMTDDVCDTAFRRSLAASIVERYPHADYPHIEAICAESPARCEDPKDRERLLLDSQNKAVAAFAANEVRSVEADRDARHAVDVANAEAARDLVVTTLVTLATPPCRRSYYPTPPLF